MPTAMKDLTDAQLAELGWGYVARTPKGTASSVFAAGHDPSAWAAEELALGNSVTALDTCPAQEGESDG